MKKLLAIAFSVILLTTIVTLIATPSRATISRSAPDSTMAAAIPDSVTSILERSCYPCHSEPGKGMALSRVNFDKWDTYNPGKQEDKAEDICKQVSKGKMPPKSFRSNNPDKVPSQAEVQVICNWAASMEVADK